MKNFVREYFTFNNREKRGLIVLVSIIVILSLALIFQHKFISQKITNDFSAFEKEIENATVLYNDSIEEEVNNHFAETLPEPTLFLFNPNNLPKQKWKLLGLSDKQINTIHNYEKKGGKFFAKEDLKKIYGISKADYNRLEPYITFLNASSAGRPETRNTITESNKPSTIEINSADSLSLVNLRGIGPAFAGRIIKYRTLLGGFHNKEQLLEVYGFTNDMYTHMEKQIEVDLNKIQKININTCDLNTIKKHPYIKYNNAKLIVNYRNAHGNYNHVDEIKNIHLINDSIFNRISFYLTTN